MSGGDSHGSRGPRGRGPDDRAEELDLAGYEADRPRPGETPRGPALLDLKTRWQTLTARQQLRLRQLGVAGAIGVLGLGLYTASGDKTEQAAPSPSSKLDMGAGLRGDSLEVKLRGDLQKILDGQQLLGDRVTAIEEGKVVPGAGTPPHALDGDLPPAIPGSVPDFPEPPATGDIDPSVAKPPAPPAAPPKMRSIYLPPGFMKARLLTGIDALASRDATNNPEPLIARVQAPAVLPNDVKANLAGCFVIGNATGSLAKERVEVQLVSLSCVDFDERSVVDQPIKGFFVDADGKKGLSGKVVTRAGAALARAFIAGTITGVADTVQNTIGDVSTSALGSVRTLDAGDAAKAGIAGGLSRSSEKLTDFYLDLARQAGPIVEVGAAKDVVVVIQEGVTLEIKPTAGSKF
ncbi:MAG: conjugal transfer protein TraB [Sphingobium sp. 32-64-5]|nr:MAG: conjugal transfer protein TraB [Sphingobium sp. 32-64-5]